MHHSLYYITSARLLTILKFVSLWICHLTFQLCHMINSIIKRWKRLTPMWLMICEKEMTPASLLQLTSREDYHCSQEADNMENECDIYDAMHTRTQKSERDGGKMCSDDTKSNWALRSSASFAEVQGWTKRERRVLDFSVIDNLRTRCHFSHGNKDTWHSISWTCNFS